MLKLAVPVFHISNAAAAQDFYSRRLGFRLDFAHRAVETQLDPCYMGISRDGAWLHLSSYSGDAAPGGVTNIVVDNVDELHSEFLAKSVIIDPPPTDRTWGTREMYIKDADGNSLRFQQLS